LACNPSITTEDACVDAAVKSKFGESAVKVEPGRDHSRWVTADHIAPSPKALHMLRFIPVLAKHRVVMCYSMLHGDGKALRTACDSLVVQ